MRRVAAIDVGTNSVRLLVADTTGGAVEEVTRDLLMTRLGEGVDTAKMLGDEPLARTVDAIARYHARALGSGAEAIRIAATSAVRDAGNRDRFVEAVHGATGLRPDVLSGEEEARLSFRGAASALGNDGRLLVLDVGGGSTEFVRGAGEVEAWISIDIGSVRLTERHVRHDPPRQDELDALAAEADAAVERARSVVGGADAVLVGLAGTVTTIAAVSLGLDAYDRERIHHCRLPAAELHRVSDLLSRTPVAERKRFPAMPPGREDVIVAGAVILERVMKGFGFRQMIVSESDILDGLVLSIPGDV